MSSDQVDITIDDNKQLPVEVVDWNGLIKYTQLLCQGTDKKVKICMVDEEQEEIRLQNKDEFDLNVKYAGDHGFKSLKLIVYIDDKRIFDGIYHIAKPTEKMSFPVDKLQILLDNCLAEKWYIPVKEDEPLAVCLTAAVRLAQEGKLETNVECQRFIENIVPEAFKKLQNCQSVLSWPREIQCGIFEMLELLVDLVGIRLRYPPVPVTLLDTLAMTFDTNTTFSQKHKNEILPTQRTYTINEEQFLCEKFSNERFGWLRSIIQRFIAQNGLKNVRLQFEYIDSSNSTMAAMQYNALLKLFSKCNQCINAQRFRLIFTRPIHQAIQYLQTQKSSNEVNELNKTLIDICYKYELKEEINELVALPFTSNLFEMPSPPVESCCETTPLIEVPASIQRKSKSPDCYERLADDIHELTMNNGDAERKSIKKQRTDEQPPTPLFTRSHVLDCIDELLSSTDKRSLKRKHRREQQRSAIAPINNGHVNKKESKRSNTTTISSNKTYDRSNPEDILRYFAPMKLKIVTLYDNLLTATSNGNLREVLKIEEKLKLLRPFSARFIADENTPDGTPMQPGQVFRKGWIVLNDGSMPWDSNDIQLINLTDGIEVVQQPIVPITAPHARAVITVDYKCANEAGTYESKWILAYRQQTFGPMIWCSIEVSDPTIVEKSITDANEFCELSETFEFVEVPLPACFDLTKPYQTEMKTSSNSSLQSSFSLPRSDSTEIPLTYFNSLNIDNLQSPYFSDSDSLSTYMYSPLPPPLVPEINETSVPTNSSIDDPTSLIELAPPTENRSITPPILPTNNNEERQSTRLNQPLDFVDTVVTNFFSVAKQAGSTAKAIFHTLQAFDDEPITSVETSVQEKQPTLINTFITNQTSSDALLERMDEVSTTATTSTSSVSSNDPMKRLIEMGFANRAKNQRLLKDNANDLAKVIELLSLDNNEDTDWFAHRH